MIFLIPITLAVFVMTVYVYATFGAATMYGYAWLAGEAPVFDRLTVAAWVAPIAVIAIFVFLIRIVRFFWRLRNP